jgi:hypothetical protein
LLNVERQDGCFAKDNMEGPATACQIPVSGIFRPRGIQLCQAS